MKSKPTLALLHGWGMNPRVFDMLVAQLHQHFTLLPLALPGHGGTEILTTNTLSAWAAQLSTQLPQQTMLLGWSLGGQVAMRIALDYPTQIQRLILVSSTPKFVLDDNWQAGINLTDITAFGEDMQNDPRATLLRFLTLQTGLADLRWHLLPSDTPIQPLIVGDNAAALTLSRALLDRGLLVPAIRTPTVPQGTARLRITLSAAHTSDDIEQLIAALHEV